MKIYAFKESDLASRTAASILRKEFVSHIVENKSKVEVDFINVKSITDGFSDELFAVMALENGLQFVLDNVLFLNASDIVLESVALSVDKRLSNQ